MGLGGSRRATDAVAPVMTRYLLYRAPVWTGAENLDPPGFDPQTIQSVARHYTDSRYPGSRLELEGKEV